MIRRTLTVLRALVALMAMFGLAFRVPVLLVALTGNPVPINWTSNQPLTNDPSVGRLGSSESSGGRWAVVVFGSVISSSETGLTGCARDTLQP
jgi:hypothetical protein